MKALDKQIEDWKKEYGGVYRLPVDDKTAYLREPKMTDFKRAFTAMNVDGDIGFGEAMLNALFIGGDQEVKNDDSYFNPARRKLVGFFNYEDAEITPIAGNKSEIVINGKKCVIRIITRNDIKIAEKKNPSGKPFVTQEKLFEMVCVEMDDDFQDKNNAEIRFPLYQAIESLQNQKIAFLEKL